MLEMIAIEAAFIQNGHHIRVAETVGRSFQIRKSLTFYENFKMVNYS